MQSLASLGYEKRRRRGIGITNLRRMVAHFNRPYAEPTFKAPSGRLRDDTDQSATAFLGSSRVWATTVGNKSVADFSVTWV